jgi:hypothetical protein
MEQCSACGATWIYSLVNNLGRVTESKKVVEQILQVRGFLAVHIHRGVATDYTD